MKHWKTDRTKFLKENPYRGPYLSHSEAEAWAAKIRAVHLDSFKVIKTPKGFHVVQGIPNA